MLLNHFIETFARQYGVETPRISAAALDTLVEHAWPGNVRELKNVVERIVIRHQNGEVDRADLPLEVLRSMPAAAVAVAAAPKISRQRVGDVVRSDGHRTAVVLVVVYAPFISRDLTREDLRAIIRKGLEQTSGNYRVLVELFNMPQDDYKRFLGFLRKYQCHVPFQEFRSAAISRGGQRGGGRPVLRMNVRPIGLPRPSDAASSSATRLRRRGSCGELNEIAAGEPASPGSHARYARRRHGARDHRIREKTMTWMFGWMSRAMTPAAGH